MNKGDDKNRRKSVGRRAEDALLTLVPPRISAETALLLHELWDKAMKGDLDGAAIITREKGKHRRYIVGCSRVRPLETMGAVTQMIRELDQLEKDTG